MTAYPYAVRHCLEIQNTVSDVQWDWSSLVTENVQATTQSVIISPGGATDITLLQGGGATAVW